MSKRQSERGVLELDDGDRLLKVWYSNAVEKFQARIYTVIRTNGKFDVGVIANGPTKHQAGVMTFDSEAKAFAEAEDWVKELTDDRIRFKCIDVSGIDNSFDQFDELKRRGMNIRVRSLPLTGGRR